MLFLIIYLVGLVFAALAVRDIWRNEYRGFWPRLGISAGVLLFSWIGYFFYAFFLRHFLAEGIRL